MISNRRIISGISSAVIGSALSAHLLYNEGWCPLGRAVVYLFLFFAARIKRQASVYEYSDADEQRNGMFSQQADITNRPYTSQPFKALACNSYAVNGVAVGLYFAVNSYDNYSGDQIVYSAVVLALSCSAWLRAVSFGVILYSMRVVGIPNFFHLVRAVCISLCFWVCRFPQMDYRIAIAMAVYNLLLYWEDGACICSSVVHAVPPMLPAILAIVLFAARPCGVLTMMAVLASVQ